MMGYMKNEYQLSISDDERVFADLRSLKKMVVNLDECLTEDGRIHAGTSWFHVSEVIKPCTKVKKNEHTTLITHDGLYKVDGYGGYKLGYGCFYKELAKQ